MQQYMLLIQDQDVWETLSGDEQHAIDEEYSAFIRELRDQAGSSPLDEAITWAAKIPTARFGVVEVPSP